ncbi:hypothetical protein [Aquimarina rhabdastrellae]
MENYIAYQKCISKTEEFILLGKLNEALEYYLKLGETYSFMFPRDSYMGLQLAAYLEDKKNFDFFVSLAARSGCFESFLKSNLHIKRYIKNYGWNEKEFAKSNDIYINNINHDLKKELTVDFKYDRKSMLRYKYIPLYKQHLFKKWELETKKITEKLAVNIISYGFPSYKIIGTDDIKLFKGSLTSDMAIIILAHDPERIEEMDQSLFFEVKKGNLPIRGYAFLRDVIAFKRIKRNNIQGNTYDTYKYGSLSKWTTYDNIEYVNQNRETIGLLPLEKEEKRVIMNNNYLKMKKYSLFPKMNKENPFFHFLTEELF